MEQFEAVTVADLAESDLESLRPIIETWVRWDGQVLEEEVEADLSNMRDSLNGMNSYHYLVLRNAENVAIGVAGIRRPEPKMMKYVTSQNSGEVINVFLNNDARGKGNGRRLLEAIFEKGQNLGLDELVWNSGPRYQNTAWNFYNKVVGEPIAIARHFYGLGIHAPVWRVDLNSKTINKI